MYVSDKHSLLRGLALLSLIGAGSSLHAAFNFEVSGVQTQIFGTSTEVPRSGSSANYDSETSVGDFAVFDMVAVDDDDGSTSDFADLRVTYSADNGGIGSDIMIAQTSSGQDGSQGLKDIGTISVLIDLNSAGTAGLTFDWFAPGSFVGGVEQTGSSLLTTKINYTTFDIDFSQLVRVQTYTLDNPTLLTAMDDGTTISFEDSGADSTFDDPQTVAQFLTRDVIASHAVDVGKQSSGGPGLFMFEFRDPSVVVTFDDPQTTPVPESSAYALILSAFALVFAACRRRRGIPAE